MNAKISVFVVCDEAIISLLLYNLHECTFKEKCRKISPIVLHHSLYCVLRSSVPNQTHQISIKKALRYCFWTLGYYSSVNFCQERDIKGVITFFWSSYCGDFCKSRKILLWKNSYIDVWYDRKYASESEQWKGPITH